MAVGALAEESGAAPLDFTEMLITFSAGEGGALVRELRVRYTADGRRYLLELPYEVVMCGDEVTQAPAGVCPP